MSYRNEYIINTLRELIFKQTGNSIDKIENLKADASDRKIYRLFTNGKTFIGIFNENEKENLAFINFTGSFIKMGLNVPEIFSVSGDNLFYIEEDLGDVTLYKFTSEPSDDNHIGLYKKCLSDLLDFQIKAKENINYSYCYQTREFDLEVIDSDLAKFDEYFKRIVPENGSGESIRSAVLVHSEEVMLKLRKDFFLYRDFQPRNIMVKDKTLYYIDYQSGRRGPLQYDLASFLYSGSINISDVEREKLLEHYIYELEKYFSVVREEFISDFYFLAFLRILQMLGSYSYLSVKKNDSEVLKKIPKALKNLNSLIYKIDNGKINNYIVKLNTLID
ncbi:MAG TPA: phosphotransferase [Ignavibacteria bacterium]|nr:phosphotransferase [Ignavibacteria bacterium]